MTLSWESRARHRNTSFRRNLQNIVEAYGSYTRSDIQETAPLNATRIRRSAKGSPKGSF